jgi:hypothetical protein
MALHQKISARSLVELDRLTPPLPSTTRRSFSR